MANKYGMGTVYLRGKTYWIQYCRNGKPYQESSHSRIMADASRLLKRRNGEVAAGKAPGIRFDKTTFDELKKDLITLYTVNNMRSLDRLKISFSHLEKMFKGLAVNITTDKVNTYIKTRQEEGAANATINRELAALKQGLNEGAKSTPPKVDRVIYIKMLEENNVREGFFEKGDFLAIREKLPDHLKGLATFAYHTAWRLSEIETLKWNQVNLVTGSIRLHGEQSKNKNAREIYMVQEVKDVLTKQQADRKAKLIEAARKADAQEGEKVLPWVFLNEKGTDRIKRFDKAWTTACKLCGFHVIVDKETGKGFNLKKFHDFRRSGVRNMIEAGTSQVVAMQISGHKTVSVFNRYNIVSPGQLKEAAQRQDVHYNSQTVSNTVTPIEKGATI
jgi:integrase